MSNISGIIPVSILSILGMLVLMTTAFQISNAQSIGNSILLSNNLIESENNTTNSKLSNSTTNIVLPSWNPGTVKDNIVNFVKNVTTPDSPNYVSPEDRIAVFDNDGTLWTEKPIPSQAFFMLDRLQEIVNTNPELVQNLPIEPSKINQLLANNFTNLDLNETDVMDIALLTLSNMTQPEFNNMVEEWASTAENPQKYMKFVDMVYQPMLELIDYLQDNQFKTFIVSGGGNDFMRESLSKVYGIPPDQIIGSSIKYKYINGTDGSNATIFRESEEDTLNNEAVKAENIQLHIGQVPIFAAGNSDGDIEMLTYTDDNNNASKSIELMIHHDDGEREYSYDKGAEKILEQAPNKDWNIVSMKNDFMSMYPTLN